MSNTTIETIKHPFKDKPFIPLAILYRPKKKVEPIYRASIKMVCKKNHKKLLKFGIAKDQVVNVEPDIFNMIKFYDEENKITRHIKLPRKLMRKFKEAE